MLALKMKYKFKIYIYMNNLYLIDIINFHEIIENI